MVVMMRNLSNLTVLMSRHLTLKAWLAPSLCGMVVVIASQIVGPIHGMCGSTRRHLGLVLHQGHVRVDVAIGVGLRSLRAWMVSSLLLRPTLVLRLGLRGIHFTLNMVLRLSHVQVGSSSGGSVLVDILRMDHVRPMLVVLHLMGQVRLGVWLLFFLLSLPDIVVCDVIVDHHCVVGAVMVFIVDINVVNVFWVITLSSCFLATMVHVWLVAWLMGVSCWSWVDSTHFWVTLRVNFWSYSTWNHMNTSYYWWICWRVVVMLQSHMWRMVLSILKIVNIYHRLFTSLIGYVDIGWLTYYNFILGNLLLVNISCSLSWFLAVYCSLSQLLLLFLLLSFPFIITASSFALFVISLLRLLHCLILSFVLSNFTWLHLLQLKHFYIFLSFGLHLLVLIRLYGDVLEQIWRLGSLHDLIRRGVMWRRNLDFQRFSDLWFRHGWGVALQLDLWFLRFFWFQISFFKSIVFIHVRGRRLNKI